MTQEKYYKKLTIQFGISTISRSRTITIYRYPFVSQLFKRLTERTAVVMENKKFSRNYSEGNEYVKTSRLSLGMTQRELAEVIGVTQTSVARWETAIRNPSDRNINKIRNLLDKRILNLKDIPSDATVIVIIKTPSNIEIEEYSGSDRPMFLHIAGKTWGDSESDKLMFLQQANGQPPEL